jgi:hypothetical protein
MDRPGTCIILAKKYNIAKSSCHFGSKGSIWTGPSPKQYYMDLRSFGPYNIFLVMDRSIYCHIHANPRETKSGRKDAKGGGGAFCYILDIKSV